MKLTDRVNRDGILPKAIDLEIGGCPGAASTAYRPFLASWLYLYHLEVVSHVQASDNGLVRPVTLAQEMTDYESLFHGQFDPSMD